MKTRCFFTLVLLLTVLSTTGWSKVYFVSPDGDDDKSGLSIKDAWKSLDKVNEVAFDLYGLSQLDDIEYLSDKDSGG